MPRQQRRRRRPIIPATTLTSAAVSAAAFATNCITSVASPLPRYVDDRRRAAVRFGSAITPIRYARIRAFSLSASGHTPIYTLRWNRHRSASVTTAVVATAAIAVSTLSHTLLHTLDHNPPIHTPQASAAIA